MRRGIKTEYNGRGRSCTLYSAWSAKGIAVWLIVFLTATGVVLGEEQGNGRDVDVLRVGFSANMFVDVNKNDAKAALKAWAQVVASESGIPMEPEPSLLENTEAVTLAIRRNLIDAVALTTDQYWALLKEFEPSIFITTINDGRITEEYVLLVHRASGIDRIGDLRGRRLAVAQNPRMSLALAWIDTLLYKNGHRQAAEFFGEVTHLTKLAQVVLPVFFRKTDACLVTLQGFRTMSELNPQVGSQLKVLAISPELVPSGLWFREGYADRMRKQVLNQIDRLHTTPAGQQVLTIFHTTRLKLNPISNLNGTIEFLETHSRLCAAANGAKSVAPVRVIGEVKAGTP